MPFLVGYVALFTEIMSRASTQQGLNTEPLISNSTFDDLSCGSGECLVDTTLFILKMLLLCFIILDLTGDHVTTHSIHYTEIFLMFELIFIFYYIRFSLIN